MCIQTEWTTKSLRFNSEQRQNFLCFPKFSGSGILIVSYLMGTADYFQEESDGIVLYLLLE